MQENNYVLSNADITILAQVPKLVSHISLMKDNLANDLNTSVNNLNIKATTTEKMGFIGRGEGIAAYAVVLLINPA